VARGPAAHDDLDAEIPDPLGEHAIFEEDRDRFEIARKMLEKGREGLFGAPRCRPDLIDERDPAHIFISVLDR
jgi:hypothetical protein